MIPAKVPETSLVAPGITPKWPSAGAWIHYAQSPPIISEGQSQRKADPDEAIIAAVLNYKWRQLTHDYRLRIPLDMDQFAAVAEPHMGASTLPADFPFKVATGNGWCNRDFLPHGAKMIVDYSAEAVPGDIVMVDFDAATESMFDYFGEKHAPQYYKETYGHTRGASSLKIYTQIDGRDILMNAGQAILPRGDTRIAGVVRAVQIKDQPMYGTLVRIATREVHLISRVEETACQKS